MPQSQSWQWIPTHFTLEQFNEFVLPYWSVKIERRERIKSVLSLKSSQKEKLQMNNWLRVFEKGQICLKSS
jgi:hypothetical protein